jgi:DNA polymerase-3 subunit alpha
MGFVAIEDLQGTIELVVFPRVWDKYSEILEIDRIILVTGRVDNEGAEPKILVDEISTEFSAVVSADTPLVGKESNRDLVEPPFDMDDPSDPNEAAMFVSPVVPVPVAPAAWQDQAVASPVVSRISDEQKSAVQETPAVGFTPPEPEFPPDWEVYAVFEASGPVPARQVREAPGGGLPLVAGPVEPNPPGPEPVGPSVPGPANLPSPVEPVSEYPRTPVIASSPGIISPSGQPNLMDRLVRPAQFLVPPAAEGEEGGSVYILTVILRSSGDKARDVLRLRRIHGMITSFPGRDRFGFHVFEKGRGYLLEFPNFTVGVCPELIGRLGQVVGQENLRVDTITFQ